MEQDKSSLKEQAVQQALQFISYRKNMDVTEDKFLDLVNKIYKFYTTNEDEFSKQSNPTR